MKILIIIISNEMNINNKLNIEILNNYLHSIDDIVVEYCGISSNDDFINYEDIIKFKYKNINSKEQFSKICDFITDNKNILDYDWYIKIRPDIKLLENINFDILSNTAINAIARLYVGHKQIKNGMSVNGDGPWKDIRDCYYDTYEKYIILDDMLYIFHNNVIHKDAFDKISETIRESEWIHTKHWVERNIELNVIGIYLVLTKYNAFSGNLLC